MDLIDEIDEAFDLAEIEAVEWIDRRRNRHPYNVRNRFEHIDNLNRWDDVEFFKRFRLTKSSVLEVLALIRGQLTHQTNRNNPISPMQQLLVALRFYATGGFYGSVGDFGHIHKTTAAKIIRRVTMALAELRPQFIQMPQNRGERVLVQTNFMEISRFPRVIGVIDCTHIKIQSPGGNNAEVFRNKKGFFSLNVQCICDSQYKFRDIVAHWPGSSHDSNIFENSNIRHRFETNEFENSVLLGDSGYPLRRYLITPMANPRNETENLFNESQIRTRTVIGRTFGIWKRRFPVLFVGMRCRTVLAQNVIIATAVLHNIARNNVLDDPEILNDVAEGEEEADQEIVAHNDNNIHRAEFLEYFRTL